MYATFIRQGLSWLDSGLRQNDNQVKFQHLLQSAQ